MARKRREIPEKQPKPLAEQRVLPMQLKIGDQLVDETGEYEVGGWTYTIAAGKNAHVRVRRIDNPDVTMIRSCGARGRVTVNEQGGI
jgi:hypothetical protein